MEKNREQELIEQADAELIAEAERAFKEDVKDRKLRIKHAEERVERMKKDLSSLTVAMFLENRPKKECSEASGRQYGRAY